MRKDFWVTNICKMDVSLRDLNLTIKSFCSVNLLDSKHYHYTLEQLEKSAEKGSLYNKRDRIVIRNVAPKIIKKEMPVIMETSIPSRQRSIYEITQQNYEELNVSDEQFAEENADLAEMDRQPLIIKDK